MINLLGKAKTLIEVAVLIMLIFLGKSNYTEVKELTKIDEQVQGVSLAVQSVTSALGMLFDNDDDAK